MNTMVQFKPIFTNKAKAKFGRHGLHIIPDLLKPLPSGLLKVLFGELGAAGAWTLTDAARTKLLDGTFDIDSDTWKMALFTSSSNLGASSTTFAGVDNEVGTTNTGYSAGGASIVLTLSGTTTVKVDIQTDPVWTAGSAGLTARFAAIYEVGGNVLCYCLLDSTPADVSVTSGNTLTVAAHTNGVFTLA